MGITDLQLENLKWMVEHVPAGTVESVLNFCHYCLNDDKLVDFLDFFEERGIGVINASPFSMGLLTQRGVPAWHPAPQALVDACKRAAAHCAAKDYPIEKLAMQFSLQNPRPVQYHQTGKPPEERRLYGRAHRPAARAGSAGNHRRPVPRFLVKHLIPC